jgi:PLP dependent protein
MSTVSTNLKANLLLLQDRIAQACVNCGRKVDEVKIMAVTKRFPLEVAAAAVEAGLTRLGENRVQEGVDKIQTASFKAQWELIGHLQSNKAQLAAEHFDRIQSVDSLKLAQRLARYAEQTGKKLPVLLQVNTGNDPGKYGFTAAEAVSALENLLDLQSLSVEGFMTIAPLPPEMETARKAFDDLRVLRDRLSEKSGHSMPELSMGMSFDLEAAIAAGSTCIRVGSGLFGERPV